MAVEYEPENSILVDARKNVETYKMLETTLCSKNDASISMAKRLRALFTLKSLGGELAIQAIEKAFQDESSALLKHELAYVLGQMKDERAVPVLINVLDDQQEDPMVRHEAAEALGAISDKIALPILQKYLNDPEDCVRETCELAVDLINFNENNKLCVDESDEIPSSGFCSVDPAPAMKSTKSIDELKKMLLNKDETLFKRYRAMFTLRNLNNTESVLALVEGFNDTSALFRHEIAYVLGQMQHPESVPALVDRLQDSQELGMVRHECAEALGSIAHPDVIPVLDKFAKDDVQVVRESCIVGLDMVEYETSNQFQYADGLNTSA